MDSLKLKIGDLYIHEEKTLRGDTSRMSVFQPTKLIKRYYNKNYLTNPLITTEYTEYYKAIYYFHYKRLSRYGPETQLRNAIIRNQEMISESEPLKDNIKHFFDKLFELKENMVE